MQAFLAQHSLDFGKVPCWYDGNSRLNHPKNEAGMLICKQMGMGTLGTLGRLARWNWKLRATLAISPPHPWHL